MAAREALLLFLEDLDQRRGWPLVAISSASALLLFLFSANSERTVMVERHACLFLLFVEQSADNGLEVNVNEQEDLEE